MAGYSAANGGYEHPLTKKTYTVIAATGYDGHAQGDVFEAELDEDAEERAIERGSLKVGKHTTKKEEKADG
jgi:hypothetical protein